MTEFTKIDMSDYMQLVADSATDEEFLKGLERLQHEAEGKAVSVIDEAAAVYWREIRNHPHAMKRLSLEDIKTIFDTCVVPSIDRVRALDREHSEDKP